MRETREERRDTRDDRRHKRDYVEIYEIRAKHEDIRWKREPIIEKS